MTALERLLDLQRHDTALDQLHHRHRTLPERARRDAAARSRDELATTTAPVRAERAELGSRQSRLEDEIAGLGDKIAHVDTQLYGGAITSPKEAQALQADLESLNRRRTQLEDEVLELMEEAEPLDARLAEIDREDAGLAADHDEAAAALADAERELEERIAELDAERAALVDGLDPALVAAYEGLRPQHEGVAIARLQGSTCQGCHLGLAALEVERLRQEPPDAVAFCPECGRILVR
ncbi:MAG: C4-type zinc ribbon domain-containing protein [Acidimicrobiales bacterium]|nr:C4-type zinc ribbon domain-containing protein [Acidimicrobiales bacterium]